MTIARMRSAAWTLMRTRVIPALSRNPVGGLERWIPAKGMRE